LPDTLWPVFESNRWLLNDVCRLAVENLLYAARKRGLEPRQPGGCKLKTAPVRPVVAARPAEYVCSEDL
ncbi:hypothetical protein LVT19_31695, partial [Klebsiella pneumoniae]|nr:hypothetical protein [Klebsiella pneumoniae]